MVKRVREEKDVSPGLQDLYYDLKKTYGQDMVHMASEKLPVDSIPTGSLTLDRALGIGGFPRGYQIEVYGPEQGGKSVISLLFAASVQKHFPKAHVALIEPEQQFDPTWATSLGVDLDRLYLVQPQTAEQVSDISEKFLRSGYFPLIIIDSVGAMITADELGKEAGQASYGGAAKIVTRMVKENGIFAAKYKAIVLYINQVRDNTESNAKYVKYITPGGNALKHFCTIRLEVARTSDNYSVQYHKEEIEVGYKVKIKVKKNKVGPPKREASYWFYHTPWSRDNLDYEVGIDTIEELFRMAIMYDIINQGGAMYYYDVGTENSLQFKIRGAAEVQMMIRKSPELQQELREKVLLTKE